MRKAYKSLISFAVILIAGLNYIIPAFAIDPFSAIAIGGIGGASGAGLFGSMASASGIVINFPSGVTSDPMDALWNELNPDHIYFSGEKGQKTVVDPQTQIPSVYDYLKVDLSDWLAAQSEFITEFAQNYNVTDNSYGNVSVPSTWRGSPLNTTLAIIPQGTGNYNIAIGVNLEVVFINNAYRIYIIIDDVVKEYYSIANNYFPLTISLYQSGSVYIKSLRAGNYTHFTYNTGENINNPYTATWQSGIVDLSIFDNYTSPVILFPADSWSPSHPTEWTVEEFLQELTEKHATGDSDLIEIEDDIGPSPPPVPDIPLGEVPFDDWIDLWGQGIYQQLENQSDTLDLIGSNGEDQIEELESIDSNIDDLNQTAESIDTNIGIGNGILGGIRSLAQSVVDYLEGIAEHVEELVEEIVEGTETLIAGILNQIPQAFGIIFDPIKRASSIWHYVVEWVQSIGEPFQFIWSMASGTSYYIILPVYASLAASVVLAFYKRFGK